MNKGMIERSVYVIADVLLVAGAIAVGLLAFGINVFQGGLVQQYAPMLLKPLQIAIGLAGVIGLYQLVTGCKCCCK